MSEFLQYDLHFEAETFLGKDVADMIREGVGFHPQRIYAYNAFRLDKNFALEDLKTLEWESYGVQVSLWARETEKVNGDPRYFSILEKGFENGTQAQVIKFIIHAQELGKVPLIERLLAHPRLRVAYCRDEEDNWQQNASSPTAYQVRGRSYAHLNVYFDEEWVEEKIDISHNPGRSTFVNGYELSSCWRMWFGPSFYELVSQERLLAFPQARRVEQTDSGHVFIELYADPFEADLPENREVQQAFRDWVEMEEFK